MCMQIFNPIITKAWRNSVHSHLPLRILLTNLTHLPKLTFDQSHLLRQTYLTYFTWPQEKLTDPKDISQDRGSLQQTSPLLPCLFLLTMLSLVIAEPRECKTGPLDASSLLCWGVTHVVGNERDICLSVCISL